MKRILLAIAVLLVTLAPAAAHASVATELCNFVPTNPTISGGVVSAKWKISCTGPVQTTYIETKWFKDGVGQGGTVGKTCVNAAVCTASRTLGTSPGTHCYKLRGEAWMSAEADPSYFTQRFTASICYP